MVMKKLREFLKRNSEFLTVPAALAIWFAFGKIASAFDLHVYGAGIFQKILFSIVAILVLNGLAWGLLRVNFPYLKKFLDSDNTDKWFYLDEKQKLKYSTLLYLAYFFAMVFIAAMV
jgi:hypothetical protein